MPSTASSAASRLRAFSFKFWALHALVLSSETRAWMRVVRLSHSLSPTANSEAFSKNVMVRLFECICSAPKKSCRRSKVVEGFGRNQICHGKRHQESWVRTLTRWRIPANTEPRLLIAEALPRPCGGRGSPRGGPTGAAGSHARTAGAPDL